MGSSPAAGQASPAPDPPEVDREALESAVRDLLGALGEDVRREGIVDTTKRVAKAMAFAVRGYGMSAVAHVESALFHEQGLQDDEAALAAAANATPAESTVDTGVVEELPDPLEYSQKQLQEYGDNQFQMGMAQARETEAAALTESRHRLEALIATLSEQRVDSSNFYEPLKTLLLKTVGAILHTPLIESRTAVEATLAQLLNEIDR